MAQNEPSGADHELKTLQSEGIIIYRHMACDGDLIPPQAFFTLDLLLESLLFLFFRFGKKTMATSCLLGKSFFLFPLLCARLS